MEWKGLRHPYGLPQCPMMLGAVEKTENGDPLPVKKAMMKPPPILTLAGLAKQDELWEVLMAPYSYKESPRLWANFRDDELQKWSLDFGPDGH
eukprot:s4078_g4.t1